MSHRQSATARAREERRLREAAAKSRVRRRRLAVRVGAALAAAAVLAAGAALASSRGRRSVPAPPLPALRLRTLQSLGSLGSPGAPGPLGPEGVPLPQAPELAPAGAGLHAVDGIQCLSNEQLVFHIHAHLTVFDRGQPRTIPYGIGIQAPRPLSTPAGIFVGGGACFFYLHTHSADGIIHIESPVTRTYTLGNFFDVWGQPLGANRVGPAVGHVTALYNGRLFVGDPRQIPLTAHAQIQLEIGRPLVAPVTITFPNGL